MPMPSPPQVLRAGGSVRARLTALTVLIVVVPLLVAIALTMTLLHRSLTASLQARTEQSGSEVAALLAREGVAGLQGDAEVLADRGRIVQVIDPAGAVVFASARSATRSPLSDLRPSVGQAVVTGAEPLPMPGHPAPLVVAQGVESGGTRYTVFVVADQEDQHEAVTETGKALLLGLPVLLIGVAGATWLLVGRTLAPVDRIRQTAQAITGSHLEARVPVPATRDEVAQLATTMNAMLDRLQEAQRTQRRFVADASHELRSPLASLRAAIQYGAAGEADGWADLAPLMDRESARLQGLIDDLLTLSKADDAGTIPLHRVELDLDEVLEAEARRLKVAGARTVSRAITPIRVVGDEGQLVRLVRNLVDNAARAATATVALGLTRSASGDAVLTVDDDGPGIPAADRRRVFERFVRLDDARSRGSGGSGLGLAIVAEIVRAHHGSVTIEQSPLGGARFVVTLPAPPQPADPEETDAETADPPAHTPRRRHRGDSC